MPIAIRVVPEAAFDEWLAAAKAKDWKKARGILTAATRRLRISRSSPKPTPKLIGDAVADLQPTRLLDTRRRH